MAYQIKDMMTNKYITPHVTEGTWVEMDTGDDCICFDTREEAINLEGLPPLKRPFIELVEVDV